MRLSVCPPPGGRGMKGEGRGASLNRFLPGHRARKVHTHVRYRRGEAGFTLIELLIVVAILAILAAVLIPNFLRARAHTQLATSKRNLKNMAAALELYYGDNHSYPAVSNDQYHNLADRRARPIAQCTN